MTLLSLTDYYSALTMAIYTASLFELGSWCRFRGLFTSILPRYCPMLLSSGTVNTSRSHTVVQGTAYLYNSQSSGLQDCHQCLIRDFGDGRGRSSQAVIGLGVGLGIPGRKPNDPTALHYFVTPCRPSPLLSLEGFC